MKKILITGFMHSGTSILKSIIGHIPEVHEIYNEAKEAFLSEEHKIVSYYHPCFQNIVSEALQEDENYILIKEPNIITEITQDKYKNYIIILIIRNPLWVFSSMNRRVGFHCDGDLEHYSKAAELFLDFRLNKRHNIYTIKYEELFFDNYRKLKNILDSIGLNYTNDIFDNSKYRNRTADWIDEDAAITTCSSPLQHEAFRTYQINQPFIDNNTEDKIDIPFHQLDYFKNTSPIWRLYPDVLTYSKLRLQI